MTHRMNLTPRYRRPLLGLVLATLAVVACGREHKVKECLESCDNAARECGHKDKACGEREHACRSECERL